MGMKEIEILQDRLVAHEDAKRKAWWENYVKGSAPFLGVRMGDVRKEVHAWYGRELAGKGLDEVSVALSLFALPHTEEKLAGTLLLQEILLPKGVFSCRDLEKLEELFAKGLLYDLSLIHI